MPLHRFSSMEDARRALWTTSSAPDLVTRIRRLWKFHERLVPRRFASGVTKFRSIEEANAAPPEAR